MKNLKLRLRSVLVAIPLAVALSSCAEPTDQHFHPTSYPAITDIYWYRGIAGGPFTVDLFNNLWQIDENIGSGGHRIERITPKGQLTFIHGNYITDPQAIAIGPHGDVWIANTGDKFSNPPASLARVWPLPAHAILLPHKHRDIDGLAFAKDGSMWFSESSLNRIGHIETDGHSEEFRVPFRVLPMGILITGKTLWFLGDIGTGVGSFDLRSKQFNQYAFANQPCGFLAYSTDSILVSADNNLVRLYSNGLRTKLNSNPIPCMGSMALDKNSNIWFAQDGKIGAFNLRNQSWTFLNVPAQKGGGVVMDRNGNVWSLVSDQWGIDGFIDGFVKVQTIP